MQYEIDLPPDYGPDRVRERVATRGSGTDALPGLGLKAYVLRERGVDGSPVDQYAPFYWWASPAGMHAFLLGPGFAGLCADFGRPVVRRWSGLALAAGPDAGGRAVAATRTSTPLGADRPLGDAVEAVVEEVAGAARLPGVSHAAAVLDAAAWEVVRFTLWTGPAPAGPGVRYEVLHTSAPALADLPRGRLW
jgi:hypothetical protein